MSRSKPKLRAIQALGLLAGALALALVLVAGSAVSAAPAFQGGATAVAQPTAVLNQSAPDASNAVPGSSSDAVPGSSNGAIQTGQAPVDAQQQVTPLAPWPVFLLLLALLFASVLAFSFRARQDAAR